MSTVTKLWEQPIGHTSLQLPTVSGDLALDIARFDLVHPEISGNKIYKLYPWLEDYYDQNFKSIISYGGSHSNHVHALSYLCAQEQIPLQLYVRGWEGQLTPTLRDAQYWGAELLPIARTAYREHRYAPPQSEGALVIPEGGLGEPGVRGAATMYDLSHAKDYDVILTPMGSGTTFSGLATSLREGQTLLGMLLFKTDLEQYKSQLYHRDDKAEIFYEPSLGSFGRIKSELLETQSLLEHGYQLPLDLIYGSRAFYQILHNLELSQRLIDRKVLYIHTGGLQGNRATLAQNT